MGVYREYTENGRDFKEIMKDIILVYFAEEKTCNTAKEELDCDQTKELKPFIIN